jgi:hypothetical protein
MLLTLIAVLIIALLWTIYTKMKTLPQICAQLQQQGMNIRLPFTYAATDGAALVKLANDLPRLQEGFVVYDNKSGRRLKIKSSVYVAVHHLRGNGIPSQGKLMELVLKNEQAELLTYFAEFSEYVAPIEQALEILLTEADQLVEATHDLPTQKDFALAVKDTPLAPLLFKTRALHSGARHTFSQLDINLQCKILGKFL